MRAATTSFSSQSTCLRKLGVSVRALLLENVRNLLDMDDGETFREVIHSSIPRTSTGTQHDPLPVDR